MNEQLEEQAALYVLELLEPVERAAFEAKILKDAELRRYVDDLLESTAKYAHAAPLRLPPPGLEERIVNAIRADPPVARRSVPSSLNWLPWALAASFAVACAWLAADRAQLAKRIARLEHRNVIAQMQIGTLASQLSSAPKASAVVVWDSERQEGVLKVTNIPLNEEDRDYQLWIVDPDRKQPVDAGVFHVSDEGTQKIVFKSKAQVSSAKGFAVSLERKGGAPKAEGPMVLVGK